MCFSFDDEAVDIGDAVSGMRLGTYEFQVETSPRAAPLHDCRNRLLCCREMSSS